MTPPERVTRAKHDSSEAFTSVEPNKNRRLGSDTETKAYRPFNKERAQLFGTETWPGNDVCSHRALIHVRVGEKLLLFSFFFLQKEGVKALEEMVFLYYLLISTSTC